VAGQTTEWPKEYINQDPSKPYTERQGMSNMNSSKTHVIGRSMQFLLH
jgi:hypothetical protein